MRGEIITKIAEIAWFFLELAGDHR